MNTPSSRSSLLCALLCALPACNSSSSSATTSATSAGGSTATPNETAIADAAVSEPDAATETPIADAAVEAAAPAVTFQGLRSITLRSGARPPRGASPAHGSVAWTVVVAAASEGGAELSAVFQQLTQQRFAAAVGDVNCTSSAGDPYPPTVALGPSAQIVSVSFRSERDARAFAAALTEQPLWVGRARIMCAD